MTVAFNFLLLKQRSFSYIFFAHTLNYLDSPGLNSLPHCSQVIITLLFPLNPQRRPPGIATKPAATPLTALPILKLFLFAVNCVELHFGHLISTAIIVFIWLDS